METHDQDPTADDARADPWDTVSSEFGDLKGRLAETYRKVADEHGPSEEEIKQAFSTLAGAWDQVAESVSSALQDPVVREKLRGAASSFASALGNTITELGKDLKGESPTMEEEE